MRTRYKLAYHICVSMRIARIHIDAFGHLEQYRQLRVFESRSRADVIHRGHRMLQ